MLGGGSNVKQVTLTEGEGSVQLTSSLILHVLSKKENNISIGTAADLN
jgi:hypothetical protein